MGRPDPERNCRGDHARYVGKEDCRSSNGTGSYRGHTCSALFGHIRTRPIRRQIRQIAVARVGGMASPRRTRSRFNRVLECYGACPRDTQVKLFFLATGVVGQCPDCPECPGIPYGMAFFGGVVALVAHLSWVFLGEKGRVPSTVPQWIVHVIVWLFLCFGSVGAARTLQAHSDFAAVYDGATGPALLVAFARHALRAFHPKSAGTIPKAAIADKLDTAKEEPTSK